MSCTYISWRKIKAALLRTVPLLQWVALLGQLFADLYDNVIERFKKSNKAKKIPKAPQSYLLP